MEFFEVFNTISEGSLKLGKNKIDITDNKRKKQCFSSFMNEALNRDKYDRKINNSMKNSIYQDNKKLNRLDNKVSKVFKLDKVNKTDNTDGVNEIDTNKNTNLLKNKKLTLKDKEKDDTVNELTNNEEVEIVNEDIKKLVELISNLLNLDGDNAMNLQQIHKIFEYNSLYIKAFEKNLNSKTNIGLGKFEFPKIRNINEAISFFNSLLDQRREEMDIKSLLENIADNATFKELSDDLKKLVEAKSVKPVVHQDTNNSLELVKDNLNPNTSNLDYKYIKEVEADRKKSLLESEKIVSVFEDISKKSNLVKFTENNKEFTRDLESNISLLDENHSIIIDTTKLTQKKPEIIMEQQRLQKNHIFEQIIDKSRFITKGDFSELKIQLKPESLGKLTLNLVLEKGVMTAKFVTENNQVKEVIESNFSELRDALQEKGINIQNLSVSVSQDGRWFNDKNGFRAWKNSVKKSSYNKIEEVDLELNVYDLEENNPYSFKEGTLDIKV